MKSQQSHKMIYILFCLVFVIFILINIVLFSLIYQMYKLKSIIIIQENTINEIQTNVDSYIDNYVALWTTLNSITDTKSNK